MRSAERLPVIDMLRGIAILGVVYHHMYGHITVPGWHSFMVGGLAVFPYTLLSNGCQGVALFFVLSGFVLTLPYVSGRRPMHGWSDAKAFYVRRFWRLYPLLFAAVVVGALFIRPETLSWESAQRLALMLTGAFTFSEAQFMPEYNWVLWTLGLELWFSLLFPLLLAAGRRIGMLPLTLLFLIVSLSFRIYALHHRHVFPGDYNFLLGRIDDFVMGMLLARSYVHAKSVPAYVLPLGIFLTLAGFMLCDGARAFLIRADYQMISNVFISAGFFFTILGLLRMERVPRFTLLRPLEAVGVLCFSIYVWHGLLMNMMRVMGTASSSRLLAYVCCVTVASIASYAVIERGGMALHRFFARKRPLPAPQIPFLLEPALAPQEA